MENKGSFSRLEWILGLLLIILLVIVIVLSVVFWFSPKAPNTTAGGGSPQNSATIVAQNASVAGPTPVYSGRTAREAFIDAERFALNWQGDAKLLNASADWTQGATVERLAYGREAWVFTFYSAQVGKTAVYSVVDSQVTFIGEGVAPTSYTVQDITSWNLDSNEAVQILLDQGGYQFLNQENVTSLFMVLMTDNQTPSQQMEWFISLLGTESKNSIDIRLNATSGEVLELTTNP
jgi:hypothetical protein